MPEIVLDGSDRALLRQCPFTVFSSKVNRPNKAELARMQRIKRLWAAGRLRGEVEHQDGNGYLLRVTLTEVGRKELGLPNMVRAHA